MTMPSSDGVPVAGELDSVDREQRRGENGGADHHERRDRERVHAGHGVLGQQQVDAPADAGREREQQAEAGGGAGGAGENDDAGAGQHDPQPVQLAPRAEHGHAERPDELDGDDDADGHAADRPVEAEVHQEEGHRERRERQAVTPGRQAS